MLFWLFVSVFSLQLHISSEEYQKQSSVEPLNLPGEGTALSYQVADSMAQVVVAAFGDVSVCRAFGANPMSALRNQLVVHAVGVGVDLFALVAFGDALKYQPTRRFIARPHREVQRLRRLKRLGKPYPSLMSLATNISPHCIGLDRVSLTGLLGW
jgi:hypothetical protein